MGFIFGIVICILAILAMLGVFNQAGERQRGDLVLAAGDDPEAQVFVRQCLAEKWISSASMVKAIADAEEIVRRNRAADALRKFT